MFDIDIYIIANSDGDVFQVKRYKTSDFTGDVTKARLYRKIGTARGIVTKLNKINNKKCFVYKLNITSVDRV